MSAGENLEIETTAIATIAWLNDEDRYSDNIENAMNFLVSFSQLGAYGSTQATILTLKAIT